MSTYRLYFTTVMSTSVEVEADSFSEAEEQAYEKLPSAQICAQCSGWGQDWTIDTADDWELDETSFDLDGKLIETKNPWSQ